MNLLSFCFYESFSIYLFSLCVTKLRLIKPQSDDEKGMKTCNYVRGPVLSPLIRLKTSPFSGRCASELRINMYVDIENIIHGFLLSLWWNLSSLVPTKKIDLLLTPLEISSDFQWKWDYFCKPLEQPLISMRSHILFL